SFITGDYRLKEGSIYKCQGKVFTTVIEKGVRLRNVVGREDMQKQRKEHCNLRELARVIRQKDVKEAYHIGKLGKNLFEKYTTKIDNHALRREYAQKKYQELEQKLSDPKRDYYQQYDRRTINEVSKQLGHSRFRV